VTPAQQKIKKTSAALSLELEPTPDILAELGCKKGNRILIGFAAETENLRDYACAKLQAKNCDMIVGNLASAIDSDQNAVLLALRTGEVIEVPQAPKRQIADRILDQIASLRT
jgi:phosphopantothenoylcysteine decarboxylase/phosphopantothenate--cysteine ligase